MNYLRRTWAEVDLDAISANIRAIREKVGERKIIAVVKADAYGHGASLVAKLCNEIGIDYFAVSSIDEARALRADKALGDILILGYTPPELARELSDFGITQTVTDYAYALRLSEEGVKRGLVLPVHIKIDSGMSRLGIICRSEEDIAFCRDEIVKISRLPGIVIKGIFTHLSSADGSDKPDSADREYTERQFTLFRGVVDAAEKAGIDVGLRHCSNSAAVINYPSTYLDAVRPGIILYGYYPDSVVGGPLCEKLRLTPAMTLKTVVSQVKTLPAGSSVSYGREFVTSSPTKIAIVAIGYADGFIRKNSRGGEMYINGKPAKVIGRICMDMCMLDISGRDDVSEGDEAVVFGQGGKSLEEAANVCETINYELTCLIGKRVPRVYLKEGKPYLAQNIFLHE